METRNRDDAAGLSSCEARQRLTRGGTRTLRRLGGRPLSVVANEAVMSALRAPLKRRGEGWSSGGDGSKSRRDERVRGLSMKREEAAWSGEERLRGSRRARRVVKLGMSWPRRVVALGLESWLVVVERLLARRAVVGGRARQIPRQKINTKRQLPATTARCCVQCLLFWGCPSSAQTQTIHGRSYAVLDWSLFAPMTHPAGSLGGTITMLLGCTFVLGSSCDCLYLAAQGIFQLRKTNSNDSSESFKKELSSLDVTLQQDQSGVSSQSFEPPNVKTSHDSDEATPSIAGLSYTK